MLEKVWAYICGHGLFRMGDLVVVGVSGGADSMAMLHVLNDLSSRLKLRLHVAHLNHQLRGEEAQGDAAFVEAAANSLNLPCTLGSADVPAMIAREKLSTEEAARKARYSFLLKTASHLGADKVAVAHNADDQAETLLIHLLHGTGSEGLAGMKPATGLVVRPLLGIRRWEIENYCSQSGIAYRSDSTNADVTFIRNRIRHQLIPMLREYNPNIVEALLRTAEIIRVENDYIENETIVAADKVIRKTSNDSDGSGSFIVNNEAFTDLDTALQRRLVRHLFRTMAGPEKQLEFAHVERTISFIVSGQTGKTLELPDEVCVTKTYSETLFSINSINPPRSNGSSGYGAAKDQVRECALTVPGITDLSAVKAKIEAKIFSVEDVRDKVFTASPSEAYLDWDALEFPLCVGPGKEGETFYPLGSSGRKKLSDFFIDAKVPRDKRKSVPVVNDSKGIVWVAGLRIDDRAKVTDRTSQVLYLQIKSDR